MKGSHNGVDIGDFLLLTLMFVSAKMKIIVKFFMLFFLESLLPVHARSKLQVQVSESEGSLRML